MKRRFFLNAFPLIILLITTGCASTKTAMTVSPTLEEKAKFQQSYQKPQKENLAILPVMYDTERLLAAEKWLSQTFYKLGWFNVLSTGSISYDVKKLTGESISEQEIEKLKLAMTTEYPAHYLVFVTDVIATEGQKRSAAGALLGAEGGILGKGGLQNTASFEMRLRVIDLQTGKVIFNEYERVEHAMGNKTKEEVSMQTMGGVLRNLGKKILNSFPMAAAVVDVLSGNTVQIDIGKDFRLKKGMRFFVVRPSKVGIPIQIGEIEVIRVQANRSIAKVKKLNQPDNPIRIGDKITSQKL